METETNPLPTPDEIGEKLMEHFDTAVRVAQRIIHSDLENARDIAMDAVARCYARLCHTLDFSNVKSLLLTATHNLAVNARERGSLIKHLEIRQDLDTAPPNDEPETVALRNEEISILQDALAKLGKGATIINEHYILELSMEQIAGRGNMTVGAAKAQLHRKMGNLRKILSTEPKYSFR